MITVLSRFIITPLYHLRNMIYGAAAIFIAYHIYKTHKEHHLAVKTKDGSAQEDCPPALFLRFYVNSWGRTTKNKTSPAKIAKERLTVIILQNINSSTPNRLAGGFLS